MTRGAISAMPRGAERRAHTVRLAHPRNEPHMTHSLLRSLAPARIVSLAALLAAAACTRAPATTPVPATAAGFAIAEPEGFARAVQRGTRTRTGQPGPRYWTQYARYRLDASLDVATSRLDGRGTVRYINRSPDALPELAIFLYQNVNRPGAPKDDQFPPTEGMRLDSVLVAGQTVGERGRGAPGLGYAVQNTVMWLRLAQPLAAGDSIDMSFKWHFTVPQGEPAQRMGTDGEVYFIAYWYPQVAVYDDVNGWQTDPYLGVGEFYMDYADYDVSLTVPDHWVIGATGTLENASQVLTERTMARLASARTADSVVSVVGADSRGPGVATQRGEGRRLTWRWSARNVRDFAWGGSGSYLWDATSTLVGDVNGDGTPDRSLVNAFWRPGAATWREAARYGQHAVAYFSRYMFPYPYPHMTQMEGLVSGGMEYPMMTLIAMPPNDPVGLYSVTAHEIAHMWHPMLVGADEKRFPWQDEGLTNFNSAQAVRDFTQGKTDEERASQRNYATIAQRGGEVPMMTHADSFPTSAAYFIGAYEKPNIVFRALRAAVGEEAFNRAWKEYAVRWTNKHPMPQDFFNTFEQVAGRDLDWFWRSWLYETWRMDQSIAEVRPGATAGDSTFVVVENLGQAPMPIRLAVTRADGSVERSVTPVDVWLNGARRVTVGVRPGARVTRVEIDPDAQFPDVDRGNQVWNTR